MKKLLMAFVVATCLVVGPLTAGARATTPVTHPFAGLFVGSVIPGGSNIDGAFIATDLGFGHFYTQVSLVGVSQDGTVVVFATQTQLTAANGDTLESDGLAVQIPSATKDCQGSRVFGAANFTAGTGRFVDASGSNRLVACIHREVEPPRVTAFSYGTLND